jgi:hypothetical protein
MVTFDGATQSQHRGGYLFDMTEIKEQTPRHQKHYINDYIEAIIYCAFLCTITTLLLKLKALTSIDKKTVKHRCKTKGCTLNTVFSYTKIRSCCYAI